MFPLSIYFLANDVDVMDKLPGNGYWEIVFYDFHLKNLSKCYTNIALSFVGIMIFGLGSDALEMYKRLFGFGKKKPNQEMILLEYPPQTRVDSARSAWTNNSTMKDFHEYADLVTPNSEIDEILEKPDNFIINSLDLEKGEPRKVSGMTEDK